jgi:hypothetical protein
MDPVAQNDVGPMEPTPDRKRSACEVVAFDEDHDNAEAEAENKKLRRTIDDASAEFLCPITVGFNAGLTLTAWGRFTTSSLPLLEYRLPHNSFAKPLPPPNLCLYS